MVLESQVTDSVGDKDEPEVAPRTVGSRWWRHVPRGNQLDEHMWRARHRMLQWVLAAHVPALFVLGLALGNNLVMTSFVLIPPVLLLAAGNVVTRRRPASVLITAGLSYCSAALVVLSHGAIEAHFHFFIIIGFIALYQDWAPVLFNIVFVVLSHGIGSIWVPQLIFDNGLSQGNPWLWSLIHGVAVLLASVGLVLFWNATEDEQNQRVALSRRLAEVEVQRETTAREGMNSVFLSIAHRSQAIVHRQLQVLDRAERAETDPDQLDLLFQLDHLSTRERRNAENLIILGGGRPGRQWRNPVPLQELVRSAVAETEQYTRVELLPVAPVHVEGRAVADVVHLMAELLDNATSFSPPEGRIEVRGNRVGNGAVLEIEDQGLGIQADRRDQINAMLASCPEFAPPDDRQDWRLGLFVVARLADRHGIRVTLLESAYGGVRAVVLLPSALLVEPAAGSRSIAGPAGPHPRRAVPVLTGRANGDTVDVPGEVAGGEIDGGPGAPVSASPAEADPDATGPGPADPDPAGPVPDGAPRPGRAKLPSRRRQAHVAAQLRDQPPPDDAPVRNGNPSTPADESAAAARARLSALQRGTNGARREDPRARS